MFVMDSIGFGDLKGVKKNLEDKKKGQWVEKKKKIERKEKQTKKKVNTLIFCINFFGYNSCEFEVHKSIIYHYVHHTTFGH